MTSKGNFEGGLKYYVIEWEFVIMKFGAYNSVIF